MLKLLVLPALMLLSANLAAHPGHGEVASMTGTVMSVDGARIQLDTLDRASFQRKVVWVVSDDKTKYHDGKKRVVTLDLKPGQEVETTIEYEDTPDGGIRMRALQIRLRQPKKK